MTVTLVIRDSSIRTLIEKLLGKGEHSVRVVIKSSDIDTMFSDCPDVLIIDMDDPYEPFPNRALSAILALADGLPRVLLFSSNPGRLAEMPSLRSNAILGCLPKPFPLSGFKEVIDVLSHTRHKCSGTLDSPFRCRHAHCGGDIHQNSRMLCHTSQYADCPLYGFGPGRSLWDWIASSTDL